MTNGQFLTLSEICRETAVVIFGGLVIGNLLAPNANPLLTIGGFFVYLMLSFLAIYFKKKGE
jgi:hypothetical protein